MISLNERFLMFLDDEKPVLDRRPLQGALAIAGGILTLALCVSIALLWSKLYASPLFPLGLWLMGWGVAQFFQIQRERRLSVRVREIAAQGQRVNGYLIRASDALYRPSSKKHHCQVLISFQPEVSGDREYMQYLAQRWAEQTTRREHPVRYRRQKLPLALTDGSPVYCCDLSVHPGFLSSGYLTSTILPCVAEFGDKGGIELVPYWLLFPYVESPLSQRQRV
ncbi:hypothetical protein [Armatimonas sp.]|uniref:hypothetical protein n=1 Tax=Armatimonas sp. TaxID=1872638 RepID=UPI003751B476